MSSKYGRVSDPDKQHISIPADAHEYTDDINGNGYNRNGNGIYNDPVFSVELAPKSYKDTFRIACFRCQNTRKNKFMLFGGILILALTVILIIVAAASHSTKGTPPPPTPIKQGLVAYGPNENGVMRFNPANQPSYADEFDRLKEIMEEYSMEKQLKHMEHFVQCNNNMTSLAPTKVCRQFPQTFGERCHAYNMFGLHSGQPCVLLVLRQTDEVPIPLDTYTDKVPEERYSNMSVGISCEGKTNADKANLQGKDSSRVKLQGNVIDYNPPEGFPLYYFKLYNKNPEWIYPAVMVQFNDVKTHQEVTVKCTAWAQNFNDGEPQNSQKYSTEFKLDVFN